MKLIVDAALKGYESDGSLAYEFEADQKTHRHRTSLVGQAETMVGVLDIYQLNGDPKYL